MRAIVAQGYGGPEVLQMVNLPTPEAGPGQVRVRVEAAAVNPIDISTREGYLAEMIGDRPAVGLGWDLAGVVEEVGADVSRVQVGDRVVGLLDLVAVDSGAYAEQVVLDQEAVARAPESVDAVPASTFGLNATTAHQALDLLGLDAGQTVLVTGAAGGLGGYVVALAARRGLRVVAVASPPDEKEVRAFGARLVVPRGDDLNPRIREAVGSGVDGAIDAAQLGPETLAAVRDGGSFVAVTGPDTPESERGIEVKTQYVHHDGELLDQLVGLVESGTLRLRVADALPLDRAAEAHRRLAAGGVRGRLVLVP